MNLTQVEKRHAWQKIINQYKKSNQSAVDFCRDNELRLTNFYYWKKKLSDEEKPVAKFKELTNPVSEGSGLWFDFGNSDRLVIDNDFNQATLKKLMGTLLEC